MFLYLAFLFLFTDRSISFSASLSSLNFVLRHFNRNFFQNNS